MQHMNHIDSNFATINISPTILDGAILLVDYYCSSIASPQFSTHIWITRYTY